MKPSRNLYDLLVLEVVLILTISGWVVLIRLHLHDLERLSLSMIGRIPELLSVRYDKLVVKRQL